MYIITFYSFKGGVGRTMALVNAGAELARRGRKVLLVDFDLEAPGVSTYKLLRPSKPRAGIVEYVDDFRRSRRAPLVTEFTYKVEREVGKKGGQLWVMPAGRGDANYRRMLNALNWRTFYQDEDGFLLFEDTRMQWEAELHPDYVLIDARTGHTDIEGICTRQLADAVVVVFHPNAQNLAGLTEVCRHIRAEAKSGLKKVIKLHFVASNVPDLDDEDRHLRRHLSQFRKKLAIGDGAPMPIIHRNETLQLLDQPIFVLERPHSRLAREYRSLVRILQIQNPEDRDGALLFLTEMQKEWSKLVDLTLVRAWSRKPSWEDLTNPSVVDRVNLMTEKFWNDAGILFRAGEYLLQYKEAGMALKRFNRVLELEPDSAEALVNRAFCHRMLRDDKAAAEDLLHYLRDFATKFISVNGETRSAHSSNPRITRLLARAERLLVQANQARQKMNETALLELLSISLDEFLKTFDLGPVRVPAWWPGGSQDSHSGCWLLSKISMVLFQQRRWDEAIRFLQHQKVREAIESGLVPSWKPLHAFYVAIAQWGKSAAPSRELCLKALRAYEPILNYDPYANEATQDQDPYANCVSRFHGSLFQDLALLYWGAGDGNKAGDAIDQALKNLEDLQDSYGGLCPYDGISCWTFQESSAREYGNDCEEMRRMIRGEPIVPPFLGT